MGTAKVLIADDSPLVLRMIEKMLAGAGLAVVTASDGLEAVGKAISEDVQLVILDVTMPRMNGYQACRLLKSEPSTRDLPVVILTSRDQPGDRFWGLQTGADFYITKDAEPQRIVNLVRGILAAQEAEGGHRRPTPARSSVDILTRVNELLDRKLYEATILSEMGRVAGSLVRFDETFVSVMALVARAVDFSVGGMAFVEADEAEVVLLQQRSLDQAVAEEMESRVRTGLAELRSTGGAVRLRIRVLTPPAGATGPEEAALGGFRAVPVGGGEAPSGLLVLAGRHVASVPEADPFLQQVAAQAHIVLQNSRLFERVQHLAIRDSLTDVFNHRHSIELIQLEVARAARYPERALSVIMLDVDHFKDVNDQLGHLGGDAVLRDLARLLREGVRTVDAVGRYGGEEFVLLLPETGYDVALRTAERLRRQIAAHPFHAADRIVHVTVSLGVAAFPSARADSAAALLSEADLALYRAKQEGRNRAR